MPPRFHRCSVSDLAVRMKRGDTLLVPSNGSAGPAQQQQLALTLRRLGERVAGEWQVRACYGAPATDQMATFKFYQIERTI
jgi:hypothetical protein